MKKIAILILCFLITLQISCFKQMTAADLKERTADENKITRCDQIEGQYLKAFLSAYQVFIADKEIPPDKRKIENYLISFSEKSKQLEVTFIAKRTPEEIRTTVGGSSNLGKDVTYFLDKNEYKIVSQEYSK